MAPMEKIKRSVQKRRAPLRMDESPSSIEHASFVQAELEREGTALGRQRKAGGAGAPKRREGAPPVTGGGRPRSSTRLGIQHFRMSPRRSRRSRHR